MNIEIAYSLDGVSLRFSAELKPQGEALASVTHLAPEVRECVFSEAWGQLHPQVTAQLSASLQQLAGEILQKFSVSCLESALRCERVEVKPA